MNVFRQKWGHISEGSTRGGDTGCRSCRRRSCTLTYDGIHEKYFLAQTSDYLLTICETAETAARAGVGNTATFYRHSEGSLCNRSHHHPGKDLR